MLSKYSYEKDIVEVAVMMMKLIIAGSVCLSIYAISVFWSPNPVQSRISLLGYSLISVFMAITWAFGWGKIFGMPLIVEFLLMPLLCLALGLDDCFLLD